MPISLFIAIFFAISYAAVNINRDFYTKVYMQAVKIDILSVGMMTSWVYFLCDFYIGTVVAIILSALTLLFLALIHYSLYVAHKNKTNTNSAIQPQGPVFTEVSRVEATTLDGKEGVITGTLVDNRYLASLNFGDDENENFQDVIVKSEEPINIGDKFRITKLEDFDLLIEKI